MNITIRQIAEIAGVHHSTVDKVLHNRPGVSDEVRQKIKKIIEEVGYKPNLAGKALASQMDSIRIYVILFEVDAMPYIQEGVKHGLEQFSAFKIEVKYMKSTYSDVKAQVNYLKEAITKKVHGIIIMPIFSSEIKEQIDKAAGAGIPVITVDTDISDSRRMNFVGQDLEKTSRIAGRMMGVFLNGTGKIAILTASQMESGISYYVKMREKLFIHYISEHYPDIEIVRKIETKEDAETTFKQTLHILDEEPELDGIYITCGQVSEVGKAIKLKKRNPVVICFETYPEILKLLKEGIVTCTIDSELGIQAAEAVKRIMDWQLYHKKEEKEQIFTKGAIIIQESL